MADVLIWWLLIELMGLAVLPIAFRFFKQLADRGYAFIKPLGLILIGYLFWILTILGFLTNTRGTIAAVGVIVAGASWLWIRRDSAKDSLGDWARENTSTLVVTELVFTIAFLAWAGVRAYMPDITATEKPMELAFLNGVLQSEHFPPRDPWLAGYAISYYYFGYVIVGMLTMLSGIPSNITFNLAIASWFALAATGAFGLAYNLIKSNSKPLISTGYALCFSLFAPIFLVVIGNLEGLFESLRAKGIGTPEFWNWLDVKGLAQASPSGSFVPSDNWWWWRASRVIHDVALGQTQEVIDEFPQFSFLLGDMHPHVLALPFVLLALAVALNLIRNSQFDIQDASHSVRIGDFEFGILNSEFFLLPLILGGLFFLNSWDILPYGFILVAAFAIARYRRNDTWDMDAWRDLGIFVALLGVSSLIFYLPFYVGFQSQAGGILPTLLVKTRLHHYLLMFGLFIFLIGGWVARLIYEQREMSVRDWIARALPFALVFAAIPLVIELFALVIIIASPALQDQARAAFPAASDNLILSVLAAFFMPLINDPWLSLLLIVLLTALVTLIRVLKPDASTTFVLLISFTGLVLTFGVEFAYLRDQFWTRMNTVFKFYFQTWTLVSIAATYALFYLSRVLNRVTRVVWLGGFAVLLGASMIYPVFAIPSRADGFAGSPSLDGTIWIRTINPGDYFAITWLNTNAPRGARIVEAVGDAYSYGNRISSATGLPTILGWFNHENQWRGNTKLFKDDAAGIDRAADVQRIYQTLDPQETLTLLAKYDIKFVVVGGEERAKYGLTKSQIDKFGRVLTLVHDDFDVRIYSRSK